MTAPRYRFWLLDLETIRRPKPLLDPLLEVREVITVTIAPREVGQTVTGIGSEEQPQDLDEDSEPRAVRSGTQDAPITFDDESESEGRETEEDSESPEPPEPFIHSDSIEEEMEVRGGGIPRAMAARVVRWRDYEFEGQPLEDERVFRKEEETNDPYFESKIPRKPVTGKVVRKEVHVASTDVVGKPTFSPEDAHFPYTLVGPGVKDTEARGKRFLDEFRRPRKGKGKRKGKKGQAKNASPARKTIKKTAPKRVTAKVKDAKPPPSPPRRIMTRSRAKAAAAASSSSSSSEERMTLRGGSGRSTPEEEEEDLSFYGRDTTLETVSFQDRITNKGEIPSSHPLSSHRLLLDKLFDYMKLERISRKLDPHCLPPHHTDFETHLQMTFRPDAKKDFRGDPFIKGLPLMEDVVFLKAGNHEEPGNCYWRCIAFLIYGTPGAWARVKAEHKAHFASVLRNSGEGNPGTENPRRTAYEKLNEKFYETLVSSPVNPFNHMLNLYQILHVPYAWVPAAMMEVTADVYGVYLLMYEVRKNKDQTREVHSVKTAGAYNARHLFVYFTGSHYQPMTPNEFYGWEFQSPRVTAKATQAYEGSMIIPIPRTPRKGQKEVADGITHPWRRAEGGTQVPPPVPVDHTWRPGVMLTVMIEPKR